MKYENFNRVSEICQAIEQEAKFLEQLEAANIAVTISRHGKELIKLWPEVDEAAPQDYGAIAGIFLNEMRARARAIIASLRFDLEAL